jgi:copper chaperone CopZ
MITSKVLTVTAPDIECGGCASAIEKALNRLPGIEKVAVEVAEKRVTISHAATLAETEIRETLERIGFPTE